MKHLHRFVVLMIGVVLVLIGWGGFVTSINAGLAVPDWPTSFDSWDPLNPWPEWWTFTPVLAEHGHRLIGMVVGILTVIAAIWIWIIDPRPGMKGMGAVLLLLVVLQGVLGGLRVILTSLDLAVVHALTAQLFFAMLVATAVFTSRMWIGERMDTRLRPGSRGRFVPVVAVLVIATFLQLVLGALLRHPGQGINTPLAVAHIGGAVTILILIGFLAHLILAHAPDVRPLRVSIRVLSALLVIQLVLGITAYFVLLDETGMLEPGNVQVVVNTAHVVFGALLWAAVVTMALWTFRRFDEDLEIASAEA
jgi:cytochrome c oxidase assembly protein subunit 15